MSRTPIPQPLVSQAGWPDAPEAILLVSSVGGIIRFATPAVAAYYGYELDDLIGRSTLDFLDPESVEHVSFIWRMFRENPHLRSYEIHAVVRARSGRRVPVRASVWRLPDPDSFLLVHHVLDHLRDRLDTLYTIISSMSGALELGELADTVLREVHRLIPCHTSTFFILEPDGSVQARRWREDTIEVERTLPDDHMPVFPVSREMRETGLPLIVIDTHEDERWVHVSGARPIRSWLGAPLYHRGEYLGELTLDSPDVGAFNEEDAELAQALAIQVAAGIHNVRQFEAEQRRAKRFQALSEVSAAINRLELNEVLELVYRKISALMKTDAFFIGLYTPETHMVRIAGFYDRDQRLADVVIPAQSGLTAHVLRDHKSLIIQDTSDHPLVSDAVKLGDLPRSLMIIPLLVQDEIVGVISVQSYEAYAYPGDDVALLETIADAVATAVRNAQLYDQTASQLHAIETLHRVSLEFASTQQPGTIAARIIEAALHLLAPTEARLHLCDNPPWEAACWVGRRDSDAQVVRITPRETPLLGAQIACVEDTHEPLFLPQIDEDTDHLAQFGTDWPVHAAVFYPILRGEHLYGTLALLFSQPYTARPDERRVIDMLSLQAASAFENSHHTVTLTRRLNEVIALHELARRVSELDTLDDILNMVVHTVRNALGCKSASVALLEDDGYTVALRAGAGLPAEYIEGHFFALGEYVAGAVVEQGRAIYVRDTHADPNFRVIDPGVRALMSVPLTVQRRTIGTLNIDAVQPDAFDAHHERVLTIAGGQIAAAIENLRLLEQTRRHAAKLAEANEALAAEDELRRELMFQVSHDLRGPLQIVLGYADMLYNDMFGEVTAQQKEMLAVVTKRGQSIERLTHDILAARPISREMLELARVDLTELCQQAITDAQMMHRDSRFTFAGDLLPESLPVEADYHRLSRVFDNLIGNAVKFSPEGGTIRLRTRVDRANNLALVSISDEGIGIPADKQPYIFERFFRGDRAFRKQFEGSGLGLYIVQQIVEAHNGRIWVESQDGGGSTFIFALPLAER